MGKVFHILQPAEQKCRLMKTHKITYDKLLSPIHRKRSDTTSTSLNQHSFKAICDLPRKFLILLSLLNIMVQQLS